MGCLRESLCCLGGCTTAISPQAKFTIAKWYYLTLFVMAAVATWLLRDYANDWFASNTSSFSLCQESQYQGICGGQEVAIRISFGNFVFYALHTLLLLWLRHDTDVRVDLHGALWVWKTLIWGGTIVGFFFIPSSALYGYAQVARIGSGFFLVLQLILLIDLIYQINEWLVERETRWAWTLLVGGAAFCFSLGLVLIGFSYHFYAPRGSCSLNLFFITWSLVILLALVGVLFLPNRTPTAGLLTSGAVFLYASFLLYSALNSEPSDYGCIAHTNGGRKWIQIVAFFIAIATVVYSTYSAGIASKDMFGMGSADDCDDTALPYRADFFHLIFALASMYIAMLFTQWEVSPSTTAFELDQGWISTWVKMASKWTCELLYLWTVVAPAVLKGRDFGYGV